ncbi:GNAT family N-acetyltransferase [Brachybacterium sacelli]|uniref:RimJ/RimL family protein N-acetyltransferase n=1 Tax=Brachybacterium sacelli TaxID=173364 RepID=A0ABS4WZX0_9MICO|nr:GNAT family N-acetyltransferase [Brachybacterium sacelli]MBP2381754.1 RimJ/RimL family protein N-acetyltransferase [Brachybacterium sacelli]
MIHLRPLEPSDADGILAGQDELLAEEIVGRPWEPGLLTDFLARCSRWRFDGPIREYAAMVGPDGTLCGGGGLNRMASGLEAGEAAVTYWVLAAQRGRGHGAAIAAELAEAARADARISRLILWIAPHNSASQAIARGLGAESTGREERHPADARRVAVRWFLDLAPS